MNSTLMLASSGFLFAFANLSVFDGIYFHLWKFRLQEREESKFEHIVHTARSLLFIPTVILIYSVGLKGIYLWLAVFVIALDLIAEVIDVLNEKNSRQSLDGLPSAEYLLHIILTTLRVSFLVLAFAALPAGAWQLNSVVQFAIPEFSKMIVLNLLPGSVVVLALHIILIFKPRLVSELERVLKLKCCPEKLSL